MIIFSDTLRLELQPFGITVIDLRTAVIRTNLIRNIREEKKPSLPKGSIYEPTREVVEKALRQEQFDDAGIPAEKWSKLIIHNLMKQKPSPVIWRGESAWLTWFGTVLPFGTLDNFIKKLTGMDVVAKIVGK